MSAEGVARLEAIFITAAAGAVPFPLDYVEVEAGKGLVGDRYHAGVGTFSRWGGVGGEGRAVSLIEGETIDAILVETGIDLRAGEHRRNLVTRGISLACLVGKQFRIGPVLLRGTRVCTECKYLDRLAGAGTSSALKGRPGLRADVLQGGSIELSDVVDTL